jgi:hypothetical protein
MNRHHHRVLMIRVSSYLLTPLVPRDKLLSGLNGLLGSKRSDTIHRHRDRQTSAAKT